MMGSVFYSWFKRALVAALLLSNGALIAADGEYRNFLGMRFKTIPAGQFYMGTCLDPEKIEQQREVPLSHLDVPCLSGEVLDESARENEIPQHRVVISQPFQVGVYEVSLGEFKHYLASVGKKAVSQEFEQGNQQGDQAALNSLSWFEVQAFIDWINEHKPAEDRGHYRLPTEAEWEYAARAGTVSHYSFGDSEASLAEYAWYEKNAYRHGEFYAHKVGQKKPNPWGLYDMHGNVWEWAADCWHIDYQGAPSEGRAWMGCGDVSRIFRGGSWAYPKVYERSAFRYYSSPHFRHSSLGVRLVRVFP